MSLKELCLNLVKADEEGSVIKILKDEGYWDDSSAWRYYGDNENNYATIGNQQSKPESAIVEKIINSVDAVLIAKCLLKGIDPESHKAPQSIRDALIEFFGIYDGKLSNIPLKIRGKLAENICLVATGTKVNPCYLIIDKGEGQTPNKMPNTVLSIGRSNKLRVRFVQGKFNMGGTGVFRFCGRQNLQLIVSKRHPEIAKLEKDETKKKWGFTIVRREDPSQGIRNSTYRYLAPSNKILSFESDGLLLFPGKYPESYGEKLKWGTLIKLYEYQMTGLRTNILFDLYNRLSLLMPGIALPVRFFERRKGYTGHSFETTLSGLTVRLEEDKRENLEEGFPTSGILSALGQNMRASIFVFKREQSQKYTKDEGIIFIVNGQTHAHLSKSFFASKSVGMGYLADSLLVIIDCSNFNGRAKEDLFMNSRDRLCSGDLRSEIIRNLKDLIKNHQGLKELRARRRREEIENKLGDSQPLVDVIENILKKSPVLSKLFMDGIRLPHPFNVEKAKADKIYVGKKFPTVFTLINKYPVENPKICPINVRLRVQYKTDVINDYFDRDSDPGTFLLKVNGEGIQDYSLNLWNGIVNLNVRLPSKNCVDNVLHFESKVSDVSRVVSFEDEFFAKIQEPVVKRSSKSGKRKPPASKEKGDDVEKTSYLDIPNVIEIRKDEWHKHSFNNESALRVVDNGEEGYDFFVNMDNIHLLSEQKENLTIDSKLLDARYKYGMVLIGIALLKEYDSTNTETNGEEKDISSQIDYFTKAISPILLPMIASLDDLEIEEPAKVYYNE